MLTSGHLLADRYRLARRIAVGGMGEVWEAEDARLDRKVAVKVLKAELCGDAEFLHRFRVEARTTASLNHPGVAGVHDYGETNALSDDGPQDTAYLVMELVEGDPLSAILARDGRISPARTLDMLEQAGHALQAAHARGLVHRDIKPGNILLTADGTVKLTDFGIAKAADAAPVTRSGMVMGTAHYIAPEQAVGQEASPASDVYSLAVVGYECLVGHRPFRAENAVTVAMMHIRDTPPPLPTDVPPALRTLIEATLVKDPSRRYATGGEFAAAVAAVRNRRPAPPPSGYLPAQPPPEDHTPPTGLPVSPASALPIPRGPQTPPHSVPMSPVTSGSVGSPLVPHTGPHGLPLPQQHSQHAQHSPHSQQAQPDRARIWLWALLVLLLVIAATLIGWAIFAANAPAETRGTPVAGLVQHSAVRATETACSGVGNGDGGGYDSRRGGTAPNGPRVASADPGGPGSGAPWCGAASHPPIPGATT